MSSAPGPGFWENLEALVSASRVVIDRPMGSAHPRFPEVIYPLDYGYLEGSRSADGAGLDLWLGSSGEKSLQALILTVDLTRRDAEIKLLLGCSDLETTQTLDFLAGLGLQPLFLSRKSPLLEGLLTRRSVRRFRPYPVPAALLETVMSAAMHAPSAHHRQPWRFVVVAENRQSLAEAMGGEFYASLLATGESPDQAAAQADRSIGRLLAAPACILLCLEGAQIVRSPLPEQQPFEYLMGVQGVAMAGENLLLAAHALGLAGVWMCAPLFAQAVVRHALALPGSWEPHGLVLLGYPARQPDPYPRLPLEEVLLFR
jgi:F420 biosynthesis protein FbiB-like protein